MPPCCSAGVALQELRPPHAFLLHRNLDYRGHLLCLRTRCAELSAPWPPWCTMGTAGLSRGCRSHTRPSMLCCRDPSSA